jgi:hypothetical protein
MGTLEGDVQVKKVVRHQRQAGLSLALTPALLLMRGKGLGDEGIKVKDLLSTA